MKRVILLIALCLVCSGCKTIESFLKRDNSIPIIAAAEPRMETETVWVPAKTKKVWVNPHVDDNGSMIDGHYKYVILEKGHWALQEITPEAPRQIKQNSTEEELKDE